jgi:hypothetical protein
MKRGLQPLGEGKLDVWSLHWRVLHWRVLVPKTAEALARRQAASVDVQEAIVGSQQETNSSPWEDVIAVASQRP